MGVDQIISLVDKGGTIALALVVIGLLMWGQLEIGRASRRERDQLIQQNNRKDEQIATFKELTDGLAEANRQHTQTVKETLDFLQEVLIARAWDSGKPRGGAARTRKPNG